MGDTVDTFKDYPTTDILSTALELCDGERVYLTGHVAAVLYDLAADIMERNGRGDNYVYLIRRAATETREWYNSAEGKRVRAELLTTGN